MLESREADASLASAHSVTYIDEEAPERLHRPKAAASGMGGRPGLHRDTAKPTAPKEAGGKADERKMERTMSPTMVCRVHVHALVNSLNLAPYPPKSARRKIISLFRKPCRKHGRLIQQTEHATRT